MCCRTTGFLTTNLNHKPKNASKNSWYFVFDIEIPRFTTFLLR